MPGRARRARPCAPPPPSFPRPRWLAVHCCRPTPRAARAWSRLGGEWARLPRGGPASTPCARRIAAINSIEMACIRQLLEGSRAVDEPAGRPAQGTDKVTGTIPPEGRGRGRVGGGVEGFFRGLVAGRLLGVGPAFRGLSLWGLRGNGSLGGNGGLAAPRRGGGWIASESRGSGRGRSPRS